ncbi:hypothetical protein I3843_01G034000 [Carya illinoinensis]|uniref:Uncharacterized protein n=1 Tax=Carya illinoinensis TaxID=32201 RepID=A0A922FW92_CARIL|nr:hypothetical protein I3760_01G035500 [Carya illinoinensis]KAG6729613.1 hypothetical protein I3842_01G038000 [Carya illinoinensis]KAG7994011.1 hypothetical protein I3843_01G034000 [Carya illinoinensis]
MEPSRSFRLQRGSSLRIVRSYSSALVSETIPPECAEIASYERLSNSMKLSNEYSTGQNNKKDKDWGLLGKVFSFRKASANVEAKRGPENVKRKKKRSSWLPDPQKRWPVQGW